jgi:hypothetical protein
VFMGNSPPCGGNFARASRWVQVGLLCLATASTMAAADLSRYRDFRFGADLETVANLSGARTDDAELIQSRPAEILELTWRPRSRRDLSETEAVSEVVFRFYNGELYRIAVQYDRYQTEGMTNADMVDSIGAMYGDAKLVSPVTVAGLAANGIQEELVARWEDGDHSFELRRRTYGPTYRLVGVMNRLVAPEQAATVEAARLDAQEAPQREAAAAALRKATAKDELEKARAANKKKFHP